MAIQTTPWYGSFVVDDDPNGAIRVRQIGAKEFHLDSTIRYVGEKTGLEDKLTPEVITEIRNVGPSTLPNTDLTSVPQPLRWFVSQYGIHTPAALIHDRLIGVDPPIEGLTDAYTDRYFRIMLQDLGVRWIRRWLIWTAVAFRTRFKAGGLKMVSVLVWVASMIAGMTALGVGLVKSDWKLVVPALLAPALFAFLWERQYGAGLCGAFTAVWLLPPTALGALGFGIYYCLERFAGLFVDRNRAKPEPISYESF